MSAAKRQNSSTAVSQWLPRGIPWLFGPGRPVLIVLVLLGLFCGAWYWTWQRIGARVLASPEYLVELDKLEVTPRPTWIHRSDVRVEVFRELSREGSLNVMDDDLSKRISAAFARNPWVSKVCSVKMQSPAGVKVELIYRRPVCVVETPLVPLPLPVDAESVLLPSDDFSPLELNAYPRLVGVDRTPAGLTVGRRWSDACVIGGAEIAAVLGPVWEEWKLRCIQPTPPPHADGWASGDAARASGGSPTDRAANGPIAMEPSPVANIAAGSGPGAAEGVPSRPSGERTFWLITRGGTPIFWGYAPKANVAGELPTVDKIAWLRRYFADQDSLDSPNHQPLYIRAFQPASPR